MTISRSRVRLTAISRSNRALYPASPCVSICTLNAADVCEGCGRTLAEIAGWATFSKEKQWEVIDDLMRRAHADTVD